MTYSGSTQTTATGTWLGQHSDLTINPSTTLYTAAIAANSGHKWIAYQTLSSLRGTDTTSLKSYATSKGWNGDTLIIRANGTVAMKPPQAAGSPCVAGSCTTTVVNGRVVVCQWTSWRNYPDWNKPGAWYFTIYKAISGSGNYGIMEDESQNNFYQGNLGAPYTDSVTCPENSGITWPDEGAWCTGDASQAIGWEAYTTTTLRRLRMLELHRTYIPQLVDSMNAHGLKIFSNQAAYGWGRSELMQDMQRWGRSVLYGEGMLIAPTYNGYKATSWEFMDSVASWGPVRGGEATIWCYTNRQDSLAMPPGQRLKRIVHHNYCWYMMAASNYTYFTPIGNDPAANPPLLANDFKIADTATKWLDEFAVDLGPATGSRSVVVAGTYPVYRRNFQKGVILYRPGANGADMSDASAVSVSLGRTMYRINYDSTKQAASTSTTIRVGDGAVLVDSTYFTSPVTTGEITIGDATVTEGGNLVFTVTLSQAQAGNTTFNWAIGLFTATPGASCSGTTDYINVSGNKTILAGQTSATITVPTCDDAIVEVPEYLYVNLTNILPNTLISADVQGLGTINDNDFVVPPNSAVTKKVEKKVHISGQVKIGGTP